MTQVEPSPTMIVFTAQPEDSATDGNASDRGDADADYFRERELRERTAAENAASHAVRSVHQALAQRYAALSRRSP